jgi:hypothetical protein
VQAQVGDHLLIEGGKVGARRRDGEIVEIHGDDGAPPFLVRWSDTGTETLVFPGPDSHVESSAH